MKDDEKKQLPNKSRPPIIFSIQITVIPFTWDLLLTSFLWEQLPPRLGAGVQQEALADLRLQKASARTHHDEGDAFSLRGSFTTDALFFPVGSFVLIGEHEKQPFGSNEGQRG